MPLLEPYHSPKVHKAAMRPDPASLPVAGCITNGQPIRRDLIAQCGGGTGSRAGGSAGVFGGSCSGAAANVTRTVSSADLMSMKAFHRMKHHPDPDLHFTHGAKGSFFSTTATSFTPHIVHRRPPKYDWNATSAPRGTLSGIGVSVPRLDLTDTWQSTRSLEVDHAKRARTTLVERTLAKVEEGRRLASWGSTTSQTYAGSSALVETAISTLRSRQEMMASRSQFRPLMTLA